MRAADLWAIVNKYTGRAELVFRSEDSARAEFSKRFGDTWRVSRFTETLAPRDAQEGR